MTDRAYPAIVSLENVMFQYPQANHPTLRDVSLEIEEASFALVTGPSGSGKSTLLRTLNGLIPHFSGGSFGGMVRVDGRDTREHGPRSMSRLVGFVFQDPEAQMLTDRVDDEIAFGLEQQGVARIVMRKRVEEMLDLLGIVHLRERSPATLSGGERQRLAVAAALAMHPRLLVLDEPTSQLDPWGAADVLAALTRLNDDLGLTIVIAEHRLERTLVPADLIVRVDRDRGMESGTPAEMIGRFDPITLPPVTRLGRDRGWEPPAFTIKDARLALRRDTHATSPVVVDSGEISTSASRGSPAIELDGITVARSGRDVLRDLSLTIHQGELVALMGRNGSGKSTLLRTILGFERARRGRIRIGGIDWTGKDTASLKGDIGYVPQQPDAVLFHERVIDELRFSICARGIQGSPDRWLEQFDLISLAERNPRDLSAGERERVAMAAILAGEPKLLLLDEPTRGMDSHHKFDLMCMLDRSRREGMPIVIATHDVELIAGFATRVVLLGDREIIADGSPASVLSDSLTFTTQMNTLFGGSVLTVDDALRTFPSR